MVPILILLLVFVGAIVVVNLNNRFRLREIQHKETLAALEKGVDVPVRQSPPWTPRSYLLHGLIWLFAGISSFVALSAIAGSANHGGTAEDKLHAVSIARANGATPEEIQLLLNDPRAGEQKIPPAIGFLGLIPTGVGLAYLIFYRVESRKLVS
jgi:hypothetical protein